MEDVGNESDGSGIDDDVVVGMQGTDEVLQGTQNGIDSDDGKAAHGGSVIGLRRIIEKDYDAAVEPLMVDYFGKNAGAPHYTKEIFEGRFRLPRHVFNNMN